MIDRSSSMEKNADKFVNFSTYATCIQLEHDYCINSLCPDNNNNKDSEDNVFGKKIHSEFNAVDKWADSVILRLPTGDDWKKNVDREIAILKVKYPFLPEQQIRGKVYKKFGIPAVMGGVLSRGISLVGGSTPSEGPKRRRRDTNRKALKKRVKITEIFNDNTQIEQETIFSNESTSTYKDKTSSIENNEDSSSFSIDSDLTQLEILIHEFPDSQQYTNPLIMDTFSIECETTQSLTPDFQLENARRVTSPVVFETISKNLDRAQSFMQNVLLSNSALSTSRSSSDTISKNFDHAQSFIQNVLWSNSALNTSQCSSDTISIHSQFAESLSLDFLIPNSLSVSSPTLSDTVSVNSKFTGSSTPNVNIHDLQADTSIDSNVTFLASLHLSEIGRKISVDELSTKKSDSLTNETNLQMSSLKNNWQTKNLYENVIKNVQSSTKLRGRKRKCDREIVLIDLSTQSTSLTIDDIDPITELLKTEDTPYEETQLDNSLIEPVTISIGTKIPTPEFVEHNTRIKTSPDIVILDHPYSGNRKKPYLITLESEDSDNENDRSSVIKNKPTSEIVLKQLSGKNVTINKYENERSNKKNNYKGRQKKINKCEAGTAHSDDKENEPAQKRVRRTKPKTKILQNNQNETLRSDVIVRTAKKRRRPLVLEDDKDSIQSVEITSPATKKRRVYYPNSQSTLPEVKIIKDEFNIIKDDIVLTAKKHRRPLVLEDDNDSIQSVEITSPVTKKRRVYYPNSQSTLPDVKIIKDEFRLIPGQCHQQNSTPEIIDISDDAESATVVESPIADIGDTQMTILKTEFIPCRTDLPLFIMVDPLSNHCSEYDHDISKILRLTDYANHFERGTTDSLRESLNVSWPELKKSIKALTRFLDDDCSN